ncbi:MAG: hypothetical protein CMO98_00950 [Woeseia sp.]|nr:hypothetical protein [Woeseia sp.]|tara:strand:- start:117 stop:764 length:648 start_codon:yes stop_codon:yes gene_type:complete
MYDNGIVEKCWGKEDKVAMADPRIMRRDLLKVAAVIGGAGAIGFTTWRLSAVASDLAGCSQQLPVIDGCYQAKVLSTEEFELLDTLTDLIIPEDDTPGARLAGVAEFIDFYTSRDDLLTKQLRAAVTWFDTEAKRLSATCFVTMRKQDQLDWLQRIVDSAPDNDNYREARSHFYFIRQQTVLGFYSSEIGLQDLSSPFLRHVYAYEELPAYWNAE